MRQEHSEALAVLDSWVLDPRGGLPEELFLLISRLVVSADLKFRKSAD
jgi:hypothetical protein